MKYNPRLVPVRDLDEALRRTREVDPDPEVAAPIASRMRTLAIKLDGLSGETARRLKRTMLAQGGEVAISAEAYHGGQGVTSAVVMGTLEQVASLGPRLAEQPELGELAEALEGLLAALERRRFEVPTPKGRLLLGERPRLMGIVNRTPDSFYDGGRYLELSAAVARGKELVAAGADLLDVGGESTRPGAAPVAAEEEKRRVVPVIERLSAETGATISVDTMKAEVARAAVAAGAAMVNDVSALGDPAMAGVVAESGAALCLMHIRGTPQTMQHAPRYDDLFGEVMGFLRERMARATAAGVPQDAIIVDPGIGFGKTAAHNLELIRDLELLRSLGRPILLGPSNKSFIGQVLGVGPEDRFEGTAAALVAGVLGGAHVLRVHDVAGMKRFVEMAGAIARRSSE